MLTVILPASLAGTSLNSLELGDKNASALFLAFVKEKEPLDVYIFGASKEEKKYILSLGNTLRMNGFNVEIDYNNKSFKSNFKKADSLLAKYIIIIGEEEVKSKILTVKNNKTKEEYKVKLDNLIEFLDEKLGDDDED